jgi:SAM-dependent methyltransferase
MIDPSGIDPWLLANLACPRDRSPLMPTANALQCPQGHVYPVIDGVPVLLVDDAPQTFRAADRSLARANRGEADARAPELHLESIDISDDEKRGVLELAARHPEVDPVVAYLIAATNGLMYRHLIGRLHTYPIPDIPLANGDGRSLLDVGCSWGRWTIAAARRGYRAIGIDPSLGAVMAARRVARQLNVPASFVVGDARYLPFRDGVFDVLFSYSVVQHFSRADAGLAIREGGRVIAPGGCARVQMPTRYGLRCLYHQARRGFSDGHDFDVRYWPVSDLVRLFTERIGHTRVEVDGYFGIGLQQSDAGLMDRPRRLVLRVSKVLTAASRRVPWLVRLADSVYVSAVKA